MQKVLITGAGGFLGRAITERLVRCGQYDVIVTSTKKNVNKWKTGGGTL